MSEPGWSLPARIDTERVTIRRYTAADAQALHEVTVANTEYLRPWMAWIADEPKSLGQRAETIEYFTAEFDAGRDFTYGMFRRDAGEYLGGTGFHINDGMLEIGYWLRADAQGQGLVTEAAAGLARVALHYAGSARVELKIEPRNARSQGVAERLGFALERTEVGPCGGEDKLHGLWVLTPEDFPSSPATAYPRPTLYDETGTELVWPG